MLKTHKYTLVLLTSCFFVLLVNTGSWGSPIARSSHAQSIYDSIEQQLDTERRNILRSYIEVLKLQEQGIDDTRLLDALNKLYDLSHKEFTEGHVSTLFQTYQFDYSGIPLIAAQLCRDSKNISKEKKLDVIKNIASVTTDPRVLQIEVNLIKDILSQETASNFCEKQIFEGNNRYYLLLARIRIERQKDEINKSLVDQGIEDWIPSAVDEKKHLNQAVKEAYSAIREDKSLIREYYQLFRVAFEMFESHTLAISFYSFCIPILENESDLPSRQLLNSMKVELQTLRSEYSTQKVANTNR